MSCMHHPVPAIGVRYSYPHTLRSSVLQGNNCITRKRLGHSAHPDDPDDFDPLSPTVSKASSFQVGSTRRTPVSYRRIKISLGETTQQALKIEQINQINQIKDAKGACDHWSTQGSVSLTLQHTQKTQRKGDCEKTHGKGTKRHIQKHHTSDKKKGNHHKSHPNK